MSVIIVNLPLLLQQSSIIQNNINYISYESSKLRHRTDELNVLLCSHAVLKITQFASFWQRFPTEVFCQFWPDIYKVTKTLLKTHYEKKINKKSQEKNVKLQLQFKDVVYTWRRRKIVVSNSYISTLWQPMFLYSHYKI